MLRTVATKIAHNSTIPALAGNSDLRPLQDLITAEKSVLISLQRLSVDISKASEALRTWGLGEGDDLGDTLSASANILTHYSSALSQYASHGQRMRDQLKAIRTREEALDDLKRRRRSVMSNADSAEKKLSRMSPENKNLGNQQETLNRLRNEIRSLDADIIAEETALGDFKRTQVKITMGLKFGGLLECSEKGTVVGEYGKLVIAEIQEEATMPGVPRRVYYGHGRTEVLVAEAHRRVSEVVLSTTIPVKDPQMEYTSQGQGKSQEMYDNAPWGQGEGSAKYLSTPQDLANGRFLSPSLSSTPFDAPPPHSPRSANYDIRDKKESMDDFGIPAWSSSSAGASRFNTYPPKIGSGKDGEESNTLNNEPPLLQTRQDSNSFSASITEALSTIGDKPESNRGVRVSVGSSAPPSYASFAEQGLDRDVSRFSGHFSGISEEPGQLAYANEQDDPSHHDQTQYELSAVAGHHRNYAETEDADYATEHMEDLLERVAEGYSAPDIGPGDTPRAQTTFENRYQESPRSEEEERELNAAAAREIGREMESMSFTRNRRNSLPQSVHSTATDELKTSLPPQGGDGPQAVFVTIPQEAPLQPPSIPFARHTISPRPSFERLQQTSSQSTTSQSYRSPLIQARQNLPASYETQLPDLSFPSPTASRFNLPTSPPSPQITSRSPFPSSRGSPEQSPLSAPFMSKTPSASSLPPGGRTISIAAFKKAIPRKGSEATISDRRQLTTGSPSQSQLQSPVIPSGRERANSDSRPLPTPPQHDRDGDYGAGRFVTNLEDEWK